MVRKVGIASSPYFSEFGLDCYKEMKKDGFDCADVGFFTSTDGVPYTLSEAAFEKMMLDHKTAAKEAGIEIFQTHGPWRWPPQDGTEEQRAERMEKMEKAIYGTHLLGCKIMVIHPIMPYGCDSDGDYEKFMEINREFFAKLLITAEKYGVIIAFENMPFLGLTISPPQKILEFVKEMNSPYFKMCLDTGHANVFHSSPAEAVRQAGEYIVALHVHDNDGNGDHHQNPYRGNIDWEDFKSALEESLSICAVSLETDVKEKYPKPLDGVFRKALADTAKYLAGQLDK
ncbi:MAG: sugar phosphate isomerase/epimerase [Oscillospiraceae bacterium]|nr:sugar phosphate isomerase/epimerase [Candidatus Equicaccousia limihippi]